MTAGLCQKCPPGLRSKDGENAGQAGNCGGNGPEATLVGIYEAGFYAWRNKGEVARQYSDTKLGSGAGLGFRFSVHNVVNLG